MVELDLLINPDFSRYYEWSQAICDPLENSEPEIAETEQFLMNRNIKNERQNITLKKGKNYGKLRFRKKTDGKSSVREMSIELAQRATLKNKIFASTNQILRMDYI